MPNHRTALVTELRVRDFRTMTELSLELGPVCALVGEAQTGKSNLLAALRAVLDPTGAELTPADVRAGAQALAVRARLSDDGWVGVTGRPPAIARQGERRTPPVLFLPAEQRGAGVVAASASGTAPSSALRPFHDALQEALLRRSAASSATPALCAINAFEAVSEGGMSGVVVLVEEPEHSLRPQAQRYLSRLLRRLASAGNQVIYSTHSAAFLNVARMDELVFVERRAGTGTRALRPSPLTPDEDFRVLSEFDAERAELFLARAALLVEGETEKLALPFVFSALGEDADREGISIVECGGKANLVLFARVCRAAGVPFVVLYDRDARPGHRPSGTNRALHARLAAIAGPGHMVELAPDFEAVSHLRRGGHKPERAWRWFADLAPELMAPELVHAARLTLQLARGPAQPRTGAAG